MEIQRYGYKKDHGDTVLVPETNLKFDDDPFGSRNVRWDQSSQTIQIRIEAVPNKKGDTHHNYVISLRLADMPALVKILGKTASANAKLINQQGSDLKGPLVQLLACVSGFSAEPLQR